MFYHRLKIMENKIRILEAFLNENTQQDNYDSFINGFINELVNDAQHNHSRYDAEEESYIDYFDSSMITKNSMIKIKKECNEFLNKSYKLILEAINLTSNSNKKYSFEIAGYDFWHSRNGNTNSSFSNRNLGEIGIQLNKNALSFSSCYSHVDTNNYEIIEYTTS